MAFSHAQNPLLINCSFSEHHGNNISIQNSSTALHILWNALAPGAAYNSEERYPHPRCLPRTRVDSIQNIKEWAESGTSPILWLHGPAGAGKSAVAQTMCEIWAETKQLLASYFFSRTSSMRNTIRTFIPTLAYQAAQSLTGHLDDVLSIIEKNPQVLRLDVSAQLEKLIVAPLQRIFQSPREEDNKPPSFIVIDAVDECIGSENQLRLLSLILALVGTENPLPIRLLIVSRPEAHIRHAFNGLLKAVSSIESMYGDLEDVYKYLEFTFNEIHDSEKHSDMMQYVPKPWPGPDVLRELTTRSGGYFIYAATIVRYVDEEGYLCTDRLEEVLNRNARGAGVHPYRELDKIYSQILSTARNIRFLTRILGCVIVGRRTLVSFDSLAPTVSTSNIINTLFSFRPGELKMTLRGLHSLILFSETDTDDIRFYHASFSDYLLDKERSEAYFIDFDTIVRDIFTSSLNLLQLPTSPKPFIPARDWTVAMLCWSRLGLPAKDLFGHLHANGASTVANLRALVVETKHWAEELQFKIICALCAMIQLITDYSPSSELVGTVTELCQLAFVSHLSCSNTMSGLECIQDVRTLMDMDSSPLKGRSWQYQRVNIKGILKTSSAERPSIDRFLTCISRIQDQTSFNWNELVVATNLEARKWTDCRGVFKAVLESFLDNKTYWGKTCEVKTRETRLQKRLIGSARWEALSCSIESPIPPTPKSSAYDLLDLDFLNDGPPEEFSSSRDSRNSRSSNSSSSSSSSDDEGVSIVSKERRAAAMRQRMTAEQRRREEIRAAYQLLKEALRFFKGPTSKVRILEAATLEVKQRETENAELENRLKALEAERDRYRKENEAATLKLPAPIPR